MVTSAANRGWPADVPVSDLAKAGLPAASVVRPAKIATIGATDADVIGALPLPDRIRVTAAMRDRLPVLGRLIGHHRRLIRLARA